MNLIPYITLFPEQGEKEIGTLTLQNYPGIPDGEYGLLESYCTDLTCDCQRLMLNVLSKEMLEAGMLATISYGFDRNAEMAGPFLDPFNAQGIYSDAFLHLVTEILETDPEYVARLQRHYVQVKRTIENPPRSMRSLLAKLEISTPDKPNAKQRLLYGAVPTQKRSVKARRLKKAKTVGAKKLKKRRKKK